MGFYYSTWAIWAMVAIYIMQSLPDDPVTPTPPTTKGTIRPRATLTTPKEDQLSYKVFKLKPKKVKPKLRATQPGKIQKRSAIEIDQFYRNSVVQQPKVLVHVKPVENISRNKKMETEIAINYTSTMKSTLKVMRNLKEERQNYDIKNLTKFQYNLGLKRNLKSKKSILPKVPLQMALLFNNQAKSTSNVTVENTKTPKSRMENPVFKFTNSSMKQIDTDMAVRKSKWLAKIRNLKKHTTNKAIYLTSNSVTQSTKSINDKNVDSTAAHQTKRSIFNNLNTSRVIPLSENVPSSKGLETLKLDVNNVTGSVLILDLWTHASPKQNTETSIITEKYYKSTANIENTLHNEINITETLEQSTKKSAMIQKVPMRMVLKRIRRGKPKPMFSRKARKQGLEYQNKIILNPNSIQFLPNKKYPTNKRKKSTLLLKKQENNVKQQYKILSNIEIPDELDLKRFKENDGSLKNKLHKRYSDRHYFSEDRNIIF